MSAPSPGAGGLPPSRRIKRNRDFQRVRAEGGRVAHGCLLLNWLVRTPPAQSRLGVVAGKKVGAAVERARAKRLLREAFRVHQHQLRAPAEVVLVARSSIVGKAFAEAERDYLAALRRAGLLKIEGGPSEA